MGDGRSCSGGNWDCMGTPCQPMLEAFGFQWIQTKYQRRVGVQAAVGVGQSERVAHVLGHRHSPVLFFFFLLWSAVFSLVLRQAQIAPTGAVWQAE